MRRLTTVEKVNIIRAYADDLTPMIELAEKHGVSRQAIYKIIKKSGVEISKAPMAVTCMACHKEIIKPRCRIRNQRRIFCDQACYTAFLQAGYGFGRFIPNRQGQRLARNVAAKYVTMEEGYVVHHINRNQLDNDPSNLMVFRNHGDHVRWHRGLILDVDPIWDGSKI